MLDEIGICQLVTLMGVFVSTNVGWRNGENTVQKQGSIYKKYKSQKLTYFRQCGKKPHTLNG